MADNNSKLLKIKEFFDNGDYKSCAKEACLYIEILLREQIIKNLSLFSPKLRLQINQYEAERGKGSRSIDDFNMGEIVGLYRKVNFFEEYSNLFKKDMTPIRIFNLNEVVDIRNLLTHETNEDFILSEQSATVVLSLLELLIRTFENNDSLGFGHLVKSGTIISANNKEVINKSFQKYLTVLDSALGIILNGDSRKKLVMVDLGCREGYTTHQIYLQFRNSIDKIYAVCETEEFYASAQEQYGGNENIVFIHIAFDDNLFDHMMNFLDEQQIEKVDVLYSDGRVRNLKEQESFFRKVRRVLLKDGGGVIIKSFDDGSKTCFPDPDCILEKIIEKTASLPIVSDRFNGRKVYSFFWKAGFRNIKALYSINDTVGLSCDERLDLYDESFDYRINYFKKLSENEPLNSIIRNEYKEMSGYLKKLQDMFCDDSFYYCEVNYIFVAVK